MKTIARTNTGLNVVNLQNDLSTSAQLSAKFNYIQKYIPSSGDLEITFEDTYDETAGSADQLALDSVITNHDATIVDYVIISVIEEPLSSHNPHSIDYTRQIKSGIKLHPVFEFDQTGLLVKTTYYKDYVDAQNVGTEVLKVENVYAVDAAEPIKAAASVESRETTRSWKLTNGEYSTKTKVTPKLYDTTDKKNREGERRRKNLIRMVQEKMAAALLVTLNASTETEAEEELTSFFETYSSAFYTWDASGKGTIYDDIDNDTTYVWMDSVVPDIPTTQVMIPEAIGKTIREFSRDKLKGII